MSCVGKYLVMILLHIWSWGVRQLASKISWCYICLQLNHANYPCALIWSLDSYLIFTKWPYLSIKVYCNHLLQHQQSHNFSTSHSPPPWPAWSGISYSTIIKNCFMHPLKWNLPIHWGTLFWTGECQSSPIWLFGDARSLHCCPLKMRIWATHLSKIDW